MPAIGGQEEAVVEAPRPEIWVSDAKTSRSGDQLTVLAEMINPDSSQPMAIDRSGLRITVIGRSYAVEIVGCTG